MKIKGFWILIIVSIALLVFAGIVFAVYFSFIRYTNYDARQGTFGKTLIINPTRDDAFQWPYLLYIPEFVKETKSLVRLLVLPNNTGKSSDDFSIHKKGALGTLAVAKFLLNEKSLNTVFLVPIFPRPSTAMGEFTYYTHALDRDTMQIRPLYKNAITIQWKGDRLSGESFMLFKLQTLFVIQDNMPYHCIASDYNPLEKTTGVSEFERTFIFEEGWDFSQPFNFIESLKGQYGFLFKNTYIDNDGNMVNETAINNPGLKITLMYHCLDKDFPAIWDSAGKPTELYERNTLERLDNQLIAMIQDAKKKLDTDMGITLKDKINLFGFSASGMFADRFTFLHPEIVNAAAIGSPGGLPMQPIVSVGLDMLQYPIGIADYNTITGTEFNIDEFGKIKRLLFLGDQDTNDSVTYRDGFEIEDEKLVFRIIGENPLERFQKISGVFAQLGLTNNIFKIYPGVDHTFSLAMLKDITQFFVENQ